ncbi:hypothetical protein BDY21DRAFT_330802 [Lineolata rhizophorae]|uniref:Synaptobrevin n=1 Tax=Lineolata rhizophorae TaxID=578093 RepID=A0A6A6PEH1_9PEZI|nr:hypothetical protein BDY21DRAFT_330802 [Lineolata rhizophorae]
MARTSPADADAAVVSLARLLAHLEGSVLSPDADPSLRSSPYERSKVDANLEYARTLLLRLEHESAGIKDLGKKQAVLADIQTKRQVIKQLNQRLYELKQLDLDLEHTDESDSETDELDDETAPSYGPRLHHATSGIDSENPPGEGAISQSAAAEVTSTLRSRKGQENSIDSAAATGTDLFAGKRPKSPTSDDPAERSEKLLSHNRMEQDALTSSMLKMAQALKVQSVQFGESLEAEKGVLDRAGKGLDKNTTGMEAAERRMGTLRRMTEGKGWWGRMMLYAWIAGLWVLLLVIVFVLPKLRF